MTELPCSAHVRAQHVENGAYAIDVTPERRRRRKKDRSEAITERRQRLYELRGSIRHAQPIDVRQLPRGANRNTEPVARDGAPTIHGRLRRTPIEHRVQFDGLQSRRVSRQQISCGGAL
jgi:hypothetical protein